jgi:hypothetical protein
MLIDWTCLQNGSFCTYIHGVLVSNLTHSDYPKVFLGVLINFRPFSSVLYNLPYVISQSSYSTLRRVGFDTGR